MASFYFTPCKWFPCFFENGKTACFVVSNWPVASSELSEIFWGTIIVNMMEPLNVLDLNVAADELRWKSWGHLHLSSPILILP